MVNPDDLDKALEQIKKKYGNESARPASQKSSPKRIPTGDIQLDFATGGGIPLGRWCHFYGERSSAKTLTAYKIIREAQRMDKTCVLYDVEKQFDPAWALKIGVDIDKLIVVEGTTIEDTGAKLEALLSSAHIHVIDSLAAAVSIDELEAKIEEWRPGLAARAWGKVLRRANERFSDTDNTIIMINQLRTSFGGRITMEKPAGGLIIDYLSSLSLQFRRSHWLYADKAGALTPEGTDKTNTLTGDTEPGGIEFQVKVDKSRVCLPHKTARMRLDFRTGDYDELWTLAQSAIWFEMVDRAGAWYTLKSGEKVQGVNGLKNFIADNEWFAKNIKDTVLKNT